MHSVDIDVYKRQAIEWLKMERKSRTAPKEIKAIFDDAVTMTGDFVSEISRLDSDDKIKSVTVFVDPNVDEWEDVYKRQRFGSITFA